MHIHLILGFYVISERKHRKRERVRESKRE